MRLRGQGMTLTGTEGASPPLAFINVDDSEGAALLTMYPKGIVRVSDDAAFDAVEIPAETPAVEPEPVEPAPELTEPVAAAPEPVVEPVAPEPDTRAQAIADAIELTGDGDFVKTGDRAGKPKVDAVRAILDDLSVTAEEIDAVIAAGEAA